MQMKTKALLACSVTIFLFLGVVGIASAAPPVIGGPCGDGCDPVGYRCSEFCKGWHEANTAPFCWGHPKEFRHNTGSARLAAACLASCLRNAPKGNQ